MKPLVMHQNSRRSIRSVVVFFALASASLASACINEYKTLLSGKVVLDDAEYCELHGKNIDHEELTTKLLSFDRTDPTLTFEERSDKGAILIYLGRYDEAIALYRGLLREGWREYTLHSNLGTAFELIGENDSALFHIKRSLELNPDSHEGSEWIHVRILEFKIAASKGKSPASILGIGFGQGAIPSKPSGQDLALLRKHLRVQLRERMTFVKPEDAIVGELLFDLGNVQALISSLECALDMYRQAEQYGYSSPLFSERKAKLQRMTGKARFLNAVHPATDQRANWVTYLFYGGLIAVPILLVLGVVVLLRRMIRRRKRAA